MTRSQIFHRAHETTRNGIAADAAKVEELREKARAHPSPRVRRVAEERASAAERRAARTYRERFADALRLAYRVASEQATAPAAMPTDRQIAFMRDLGWTLPVEGISVARASEIIDKLIVVRDSNGRLDATDFNLPDLAAASWGFPA